MKWECTKPELMTIIKELNEKHKSIKLDFQISPRKIAFLGTMLYKDGNNNIQTNLIRKPTDEDMFSHAKSEHSKSYNIAKSIFFFYQHKKQLFFVSESSVIYKFVYLCCKSNFIC